jgi:transcriptional regulator with XRE-family HTH domain
VPINKRSARTIAQVLRHARTKAGLTQEELAIRAGMDRSYISDIERGESSVSLDLFIQICGALEIPAGTLANRIEAQLKRSS